MPPLISDPTWTFSLVLLVILVAPLLGRFRIPYIAGLIILGMLIGQNGLNLIERDRSFEIFGQVGVYYIMFMAALELDVGSMEHNWRRGICFGAITFLLPFTLGALTHSLILGQSPLTSVLMGCIYGSHTLVTYPVVARYGLTGHKSVVVSVVSTAVAMFAALLILAIAVGSLESGSGLARWLLFAAKCVAYCFVLFLLYPRLARWFLRRYDDSVAQFIFILVTMSACAAFARLCGLEGLLGAFMAGLVCGRLIPRTSPLMNRLEFVGNALFIPYFLIGVGMIVNLRMLFGDIHTIWMVGVMVLTSTLTKLLAALISKLLWRGTWESCLLTFGLTNAHSAGALAIVMVASSPGVGLADGSLAGAVVLLILFSCVISSFATTAGARRLALRDQTPEENRGSYHGKCLVTLSQPAQVEAMTMLALLIRNPYIPDSIMGLSVSYDAAEADADDLHARGKRLLRQAQAVASGADVPMTTLNRISANITSGILHTMREYDCGEVIVCLTDRQTGLPKPSLGTVIEHVVEGQHREVLALRALVPLGTLRRVVVAVPEKAEYEVGFYKWIEHICRIGEQLDCPLLYYAHADTLPLISGYMERLHASLRAEYREAATEGSFVSHLVRLAPTLGRDDMLVAVTARQGFISFRREFLSLPLELHRHASHTSVLLVYPDQWGDPLDEVSVFAPNGRAVTRKGAWLRNMFNPK